MQAPIYEPMREVNIGALGVVQETRPDGSLLISSTVSLPSYPNKITERLDYWAMKAPDRLFMAQREASGGWRKISYATMLNHVRHCASALLARKLSPEQPIIILSGNDLEHAILALAAMYVGIPYAPISTAYSLLSSDFEKLRGIAELLTPGLVFASDATQYGKAIAACFAPDVECVALTGSAPDRATSAFATFLNWPISPDLERVHAGIGPDTIAKILFTSGSTGNPKGVINTQRMLCANQAMLAHWLAFVVEEPPVLLDWLPWSHTFGGNHNFGLVLQNGGSFYIDEGKPTPDGIKQTVKNLRDIAPTLYFNVPKGYETLLPWLQDDKALRDHFFSRLKATFYAGAGLQPNLADALNQIAIATTGSRVLMLTSLGSTETAPGALSCTKETARPGVVGVPLPGLELKLVPTNGKLEARLRGPTIMPGYWRDAAQTAKAFDEEGFYCLGDALKFAVEGEAQEGFLFDGRVSEDFKLSTGTWVSVGVLRTQVIAGLAPLAKEVVIAGHDRNEITALIFPDLAACGALVPATKEDLSARALIENELVRAAFRTRLRDLVVKSTGSSTRVARIILLEEPPSIDANEITDKGSINQRAVLARRSSLVEGLYADSLSDQVISAR